MKGYYKDPETTASVFTEDGFLKTGDKGTIDAEGFLTITGRMKDQFKTDKGKFIAPAPIEMKLLKNEDIDQVCVVGIGIPQPIALIVLSVLGKAKSRNILSAALAAQLDEVNADLEPYEKLKKVVVVQSDWTIENGLLSPTLKVKRYEVEKIHLPNYPIWYKERETILWE
jgi:long-chain acyl-CoA synthetase